jgi:hypothetical protein
MCEKRVNEESFPHNKVRRKNLVLFTHRKEAALEEKGEKKERI